MRYTNDKTGDWVEISGAADTPIKDFDALYTGSLTDGHKLAAGLLAAGEFHTRRGEVLTFGPDTAPADLLGLSKRQWFWLRDRIVDAIRDEELDPEA